MIDGISLIDRVDGARIAALRREFTDCIAGDVYRFDATGRVANIENAEVDRWFSTPAAPKAGR